MIALDHLTKRYGHRVVVNDLSLQVQRGEAVALWGPNGAGKTTVFRCLLGLVSYSGCIVVAGHDARTEGKAARHAIGYVPQELCLYDDLTSMEALHFYARLKRAVRSRPPAVLAEVGLADAASRRVRELSGGMKQRLALAAALLTDPPVLLLDEPTSNLDAAARRGFLAILAGLKRSGKTIFFTSHRIREIVALADRVIVLDQGGLRAECQPVALADLLGVQWRMKIVVAEPVMDQAAAVLRHRGFAVSRNGVGLLVQVTSTRMPSPIGVLADESILVRDIAWLNEAEAPGDEEAAND